MSDCWSFMEIGGIEHDLICSGDEPVEDVFAVTEGSIEVYITSARQWVTDPDPILLGKIQTLVTKIYTSFTKLKLVDLLDKTNWFSDLESVLEQLTKTFDLDRTQLSDLKSDISLIIEKVAEEVESRKPKEFDIPIFIEILATEICSEEEFKDRYGGLFSGRCRGIALRMKKIGEGDSEEEPCPICLDDILERFDAVIMPCSHVFHKKCIGQWLNQRNSACLVCTWSYSALEAELQGSGSSLSGLVQAKNKFDMIEPLELKLTI